jgi:NADH:ubiquinone reductase (H+-translocating)
MNLSVSKHPRVVIIGGGFGGLVVAKKLRNKNVDVVLIDRHNFHTFQPLLYQVATCALEPDSIAYPLRRVLRAGNQTFRMVDVKNVSPDKKCLETNVGTLNYDFLVIATGSTTNYFGVENFRKYCMPMKSVSQALEIRNMILQNYEMALETDDEKRREALMNFVVAGGGPTGVELVGAMAEMRKHVLPKEYPELDINKMRVIIFEAGPRLLSMVAEESSEQTKAMLEKMGVQIFLNSKVENYDGNILTYNNGQTIHSKTVVWAAGVEGIVPQGTPKENIVRGNRITVDEFCRVKNTENIFAIGDVASFINDKYPKGLPGVAPVAIQQGALVGENILRTINKQSLKPFTYFDKGTLATIGKNKAVVNLGKVHMHGWFAWWVWLFVHIYYLIGFRNKFIAIFGWFWNYVTYDRALRSIIKPFKR